MDTDRYGLLLHEAKQQSFTVVGYCEFTTPEKPDTAYVVLKDHINEDKYVVAFITFGGEDGDAVIFNRLSPMETIENVMYRFSMAVRNEFAQSVVQRTRRIMP